MLLWTILIDEALIQNYTFYILPQYGIGVPTLKVSFSHYRLALRPQDKNLSKLSTEMNTAAVGG